MPDIYTDPESDGNDTNPESDGDDTDPESDEDNTNQESTSKITNQDPSDEVTVQESSDKNTNMLDDVLGENPDEDPGEDCRPIKGMHVSDNEDETTDSPDDVCGNITAEHIEKAKENPGEIDEDMPCLDPLFHPALVPEGQKCVIGRTDDPYWLLMCTWLLMTYRLKDGAGNERPWLMNFYLATLNDEGARTVQVALQQLSEEIVKAFNEPATLEVSKLDNIMLSEEMKQGYIKWFVFSDKEGKPRTNWMKVEEKCLVVMKMFYAWHGRYNAVENAKINLQRIERSVAYNIHESTEKKKEIAEQKMKALRTLQRQDLSLQDKVAATKTKNSMDEELAKIEQAIKLQERRLAKARKRLADAIENATRPKVTPKKKPKRLSPEDEKKIVEERLMELEVAMTRQLCEKGEVDPDLQAKFNETKTRRNTLDKRISGAAKKRKKGAQQPGKKPKIRKVASIKKQ